MSRYEDDCRNCEHLERQLDRAEDRAEQAERDLEGANLELRITPDLDAVRRLEQQRDELLAVVERLEYFGEALIQREYEPGSRGIADLVNAARALHQKYGVPA